MTATLPARPGGSEFRVDKAGLDRGEVLFRKEVMSEQRIAELQSQLEAILALKLPQEEAIAAVERAGFVVGTNPDGTHYCIHKL